MNLLQPPTAHPTTAFKVVWLSGASDPWSVALGPGAASWLASLALPAGHVLPTNFPYTGPSVRRRVPLALASISNLAQFALASTPLWRRAAALHWRALCASTPRLIVVAGSCGAQLLRTLAPVTPAGVRVDALGLGPVAWGRLGCLDLAIFGGRDVVARPFRSGASCRVAVVEGVGHMDYLESADVRGIASAWLDERLQGVRRGA